ncbi:MAG: hypothetical protein IAE98_03840 [Candidatus Kapabacteria bacterium]|nr:hypothetical protein [Candidatus Kapabacteria bacterium]
MRNREPVTINISDEAKRKADKAAKEIKCSRNDIIESLLLFFNVEMYERCFRYQQIQDALKGKS